MFIKFAKYFRSLIHYNTFHIRWNAKVNENDETYEREAIDKILVKSIRNDGNRVCLRCSFTHCIESTHTGLCRLRLCSFRYHKRSRCRRHHHRCCQTTADAMRRVRAPASYSHSHSFGILFD